MVCFSAPRAAKGQWKRQLRAPSRRLANWQPGQMRDVNSAGYRLRVLCKPRRRAGLVGSRQMFSRRRQGQGWHNDPPDLGELNGFIRGRLNQRNKGPPRSSTVSTFSVSLRALKDGSVSREGGSQRGNCATAAVTAFIANRARAGLVGLRQMFVRRRQLCRHTKEAQAEVRYREKLLAELDAKEAVDGKH